jgi:peptidoglycan/xylan/chitin deacetylase (PgdA/CDA1 family)
MKFNAVQLQGLLSECRGFASAYVGMYPDFVFGRGLHHGTTPVFFYHRIERELFTNHLQHLRRNGYRTLSGDELYETLRHPGLADKRHVVLTFDDGLDDLYSVVYPLLQKFRLTAVAYIVPGWVGKNGFVTWSQIGEMHKSGLVDFQSHSMNHSFIFTSPQIVDFFHPRFLGLVPAGTQLTFTGCENSSVRVPRLGSPIYSRASRLSDSRRYFANDRLEELCVSYVNDNGHEDFFEKYGWRRRLTRVIRTHTDNGKKMQIYETEAEQQQAIKDDIEGSKRLIEQRIPGKLVRHFAFPWHESGSFAKKVLLEGGYRTIGMGLLSNREHRMISPECFELSRINGDFLPALPGIGRQNFLTIMSHKISKRVWERLPECMR